YTGEAFPNRPARPPSTRPTPHSPRWPPPPPPRGAPAPAATTEQLRQAGRQARGVCKPLPAEGPVRPVAVGRQIQTERGRGCLFQRLLHDDQVAERLRHLVAAVPDHSSVHPCAREGNTAC